MKESIECRLNIHHKFLYFFWRVEKLCIKLNNKIHFIATTITQFFSSINNIKETSYLNFDPIYAGPYVLQILRESTSDKLSNLQATFREFPTINSLPPNNIRLNNHPTDISISMLLQLTLKLADIC